MRQIMVLFVIVLFVCPALALAAWLPRPAALPRRLEAVVLDADGTFLDPDHKVSPANAAAIEAARECGLR